MTFLQRLQLQLRFKLWAPLRANRHMSFYTSHAQFGEDMVARSLLEAKRNGVYVDIGAHHPVYYSNTYHFYRCGWRGINIDALPGTVDLFRALRPRDTNLQACLSDASGRDVTFFIFEQAAFSTTDPELALKRQREQGAKLIAEHRMKTMTLPECLDPHLGGRQIDLLSIDIEGADEQILRANDWERFRPKVLIFERDLPLAEVIADPLVVRLQGVGYKVAGNCGPSIVMARTD